MDRAPFARHETVNQIRAAYRACRHPVETVRWHALGLLARTDEARTPAPVAALVGLSGVTVRAVLHRWNAAGAAGWPGTGRPYWEPSGSTGPPTW